MRLAAWIGAFEGHVLISVFRRFEPPSRGKAPAATATASAVQLILGGPWHRYDYGRSTRPSGVSNTFMIRAYAGP